MNSPAPCKVAPSAEQRTALRHTLAVVGIALALRLLVLHTVITRYPPRWLFTRGMEMGLLAHSLLAGHGLSSPFGGDTGPTAIVAPVYPILVALVFRIFGEFTLASAIVVMSAQILLNLATVWLIMRIARQLFSQNTATIAGLIWACSLPLIWMPTIFWETSLSAFLLTAVFALALKYRALEHIDPIQWMRLGALCGITALVNPALLPSIAAVALWLAVVTRRKAGFRPLLAPLMFILVFTPWPVRNANVFHAFIPLRTTVGYELWMGNRPGADGFLDESLFPTFNASELADYNARGEMAYSAHKSGLARSFIAAHPATFLRLTATRTLRFWTGTGTRNGSRLFAAHALFTTLLGFLGLGLLFRSRRFEVAALFALPLALFPLPYCITHAEFRYRIVIDPLLAVACAFAVTECCKLAAKLFSRSAAAGRVTFDEAPLGIKAEALRSNSLG